MLRQFIKLILEANADGIAEVQDNNLFQQIVQKFSQELTHSPRPAGPGPHGGEYSAFVFAFVNNEKWRAYHTRYNSDEDFQALVNVSRIYRIDKYNISFLNAKTLDEYLKEEYKSFDVLVYFDDKMHEISYVNLKRLLHIAKSYEEFEVMVKRIAKEV